MAKKDLLAEARSRGLKVEDSMKVAEIEEVIKKDDKRLERASKREESKKKSRDSARFASRENPCPRCGRVNPHVHGKVA